MTGSKGSILFAIGLVVAVVGACTRSNPDYCDQDTPCEDPDTPFCDLTGAHAGQANACIANPFDAAIGLSDASPGVPDVTPGLDAAPVAISVMTAGYGNGTVTSSPPRIDCGSACEADFSEGTTIMLTATPQRGSVFAGWSGACAGGGPTCELTVDSPVTASATFRAIVFVFGNHGEPNRMYRNLDGTIAEVWASAESANTSGIDIGDLEPDGDPDVIAADGSDRVRLYRNDGATPLYERTIGETADVSTDVAFGDFDGDTDLDVAIANASLPTRVYRLLGVGEFTLVWSSTETDMEGTVSWGNLDGSGGLDLATGGANFGARVRVYANDATDWGNDLLGHTSSGSPLRVVWGDYDGDGDDDLAVADGYTPYANLVFRNDGGTLTSAFATPLVDDNSYGADWGDFDNDDDLDLVFGGDGVGAGARVYRNDGSDKFVLHWSSSETPARARDAAWCDYDGDGDLDVVLANRAAKNSVYEYDGTSFTLAWESTEVEDTRAVVCGIW